MEVFTILVGVFAILLLMLYRHLKQNKGKLEHLGIPVEPCFGIFGSLPFAHHKILYTDYFKEQFKKHGKSWGQYQGIKPVLSTIDPDIIKSVMVKNFDNFSSVFNNEFPDRHTTLDISGGEQWRSLRKALSPTFTSGKLKSMLSPMNDVADQFVAFVEKQRQNSSDGVVDLKNCFVGLALDTISTCAFGIKTNANENPDQDLVRWGKEAMANFIADSWIMDVFIQLFFHFPGMEKYVPIIPPAFDKLHNLIGDLIKQRKELNIKTDNFLARLSEIMETSKKEGNTVLSDDLVKAQGIVFFLAGFETTSNTLSTLFYNLARNPDIQEQLYDEIEEVLSRHNGVVNSDTVNDMTYMDACIQEDLRLFSPVLLHCRECNTDTEVVPGFTIKKGTRVDMNIYASHHCEEFFPNADQFKPERFIKGSGEENKVPYAYRPFGGGPRLCIGQRFAQAEMKITTAKLLSQYRIIVTSETKLNFNKGDFMLVSYPDMKVKLEKRN